MTYHIDILHADSSQDTRKASLAGELCVFHAAELKPLLLELLEPGAGCEIDLAQVSEIDTAGIQLLLLAKREAARLDCRLSFVKHSDALLRLVELFNLTSDFGDPLLITAPCEEHRYES